MIKLIFNDKGNFLLQSALTALNNELMKEDFFCTRQIQLNNSGIAVIELDQYKSLYDLVNYLFRIKLASQATTVLLVITDKQMIPRLTCGAIKISAPVSVWKKKLTSLKRDKNNIDSVVRECLSYINHHHLTKKQVIVVNCLGRGMTPAATARQLTLSIKTVYTLISQARARYGFSSSKKFHRYVINETAERALSSAKYVTIMSGDVLNVDRKCDGECPPVLISDDLTAVGSVTARNLANRYE